MNVVSMKILVLSLLINNKIKIRLQKDVINTHLSIEY